MTDAGSLLRPRPSPVFVDHCQTDRLQERERPTHVTLGYKSFSAGLAIVCFYFRTRTTRLRGRSVCPERDGFADRPDESQEKNARPAGGKIRTN